MKKELLVGLATVFFMFGVVEIANAVPVEYDLYFTDASNVTIDLGFIIDTDQNGVQKNEAGEIIYTYIDDGAHDYFYTRISRIDDQIITEENWFTAAQGDDHETDLFAAHYYLPGQRVTLLTGQDWMAPEDPTTAGYGINFLGVSDFNQTWFDQVTSVEVYDRSTGMRLVSTSQNGFQLGLTPSSVPEPASMLLFGTGLVGLAGIRRRKKA